MHRRGGSSELSAGRPEQRSDGRRGQQRTKTIYNLPSLVDSTFSTYSCLSAGRAEKSRCSPDIPLGGCHGVGSRQRALIDAVPSSCALADDAASAAGGRMLASRSPPPAAGAVVIGVAACSNREEAALSAISALQVRLIISCLTTCSHTCSKRLATPPSRPIVLHPHTLCSPARAGDVVLAASHAGRSSRAWVC